MEFVNSKPVLQQMLKAGFKKKKRNREKKFKNKMVINTYQ